MRVSIPSLIGFAVVVMFVALAYQATREEPLPDSDLRRVTPAMSTAAVAFDRAADAMVEYGTRAPLNAEDAVRMAGLLRMQADLLREGVGRDARWDDWLRGVVDGAHDTLDLAANMVRAGDPLFDRQPGSIVLDARRPVDQETEDCDGDCPDDGSPEQAIETVRRALDRITPR